MSTQPEDKKKAANYYQGITAPVVPQYMGLPELTDILTQDHSLRYIHHIEAFL